MQNFESVFMGTVFPEPSRKDFTVEHALTLAARETCTIRNDLGYTIISLSKFLKGRALFEHLFASSLSSDTQHRL